jgi:hypothetical protein
MHVSEYRWCYGPLEMRSYLPLDALRALLTSDEAVHAATTALEKREAERFRLMMQGERLTDTGRAWGDAQAALSAAVDAVPVPPGAR